MPCAIESITHPKSLFIRPSGKAVHQEEKIPKPRPPEEYRNDPPDNNPSAEVGAYRGGYVVYDQWVRSHVGRDYSRIDREARRMNWLLLLRLQLSGSRMHYEWLTPCGYMYAIDEDMATGGIDSIRLMRN